jgi:hypothetical protein
MSKPATCRSCGAPLAPDQRYCLACGTRVAAPRLDFLAELERAAHAGPHGATDPAQAQQPAAALPVGAVAAGPPPPASRLDRIGGPMGVAAVLLVALGIGFLIGQGDEQQPVAQRAPVVNIQGGLPVSSGAAADGGAGDLPADDLSTGGDGGGRAAGGGRRAAAEDAAAVQRSTQGISKDAPRRGGDINRLRAEPETTATPGAPPPVDDEPAGGGTEAEVIG